MTTFRQGKDATLVTKHLAERVFDAVQVKFREAKQNLQNAT